MKRGYILAFEMAISLYTTPLLLIIDNRAVLDKAPLSSVMLNQAIVYGINDVTTWHDDVKISWSDNQAYAVFDSEAIGYAVLSYLTN